MAEGEQTNKHIEVVVRKRRILWIAVGIVAMLLASFWIISFKNQLAVFSFKQSAEKQMLDGLKDDWQAATALTKNTALEKSAIEKEAKDKMAKLAEQLSASSSEKTAAATATSTN
ncbi:MAG: hypothetical protein PHD72_01525 [Patescibacteria group bacterium]|nr:hypothetical protein [Patescibacteria group bacterium]